MGNDWRDRFAETVARTFWTNHVRATGFPNGLLTWSELVEQYNKQPEGDTKVIVEGLRLAGRGFLLELEHHYDISPKEHTVRGEAYRGPENAGTSGS